MAGDRNGLLDFLTLSDPPPMRWSSVLLNIPEDHLIRGGSRPGMRSPDNKNIKDGAWPVDWLHCQKT